MVENDGVEFIVLVGEFLNIILFVSVYIELLGVDLSVVESIKICLIFNLNFEYGFMVLEGMVMVNGYELIEDNMVVFE